MDVRGYIDQNAPGFFEALRQWLAIPSISADPARHADVRRSAGWLAGHLRLAGFPVAEVWPAGADGAGLPAVFAHWPAADPAAPVVLVYGHHDVQPVEPLDEWVSPPFEPRQLDGQLLGRGASDDKGQVLFHALAARASVATGGTGAPPVTLKLLIEGEEEPGSPNFPALLQSRRDRLACDLVVVSDTTMWAADAGILGAPLVFLAVGLDSDRVHAPNEKVEMALLLKGAEAAAYLWGELATGPREPAAAP